MRAGRLRHKVIIQQATETKDSHGQMIASWGTFATVFAAVEPLNGREFWQSSQLNSEVTVRIRLRYLSGITPKMRVSFSGNLYNIESIVDNAERNKEMQLMCSEGVLK